MDYGRQLLRFTDEMSRQSRVEIARTRALRDVTRETICDTRAGIAECRRLGRLLDRSTSNFTTTGTVTV
jgi:hypothetical protein